MVKKVEYRGSFLTEYKKDIEGASELLKKLPKNEKLKKINGIRTFELFERGGRNAQ